MNLKYSYTLPGTVISWETKNLASVVGAPDIEFTFRNLNGVVPKTIQDAYLSELSTTFDDAGGHPVPDPRDYDTITKIDMSVADAIGIANFMISSLADVSAAHATMMQKFIFFKSAQIGCIRGEVGQVIIRKNAEVARTDVSGVAVYDFIYYGDVETETVIYEVLGLESYIPHDKDGQYEWLRSIVGGNHQYTPEIAIKLEGFTFEEVSDSFYSQLRKVIESQVISG